jgi:hypothetical protein
VSDGVVAGITGLILAVFALFGIRPQVTPVTSPAPVTGAAPASRYN